MTEKIAVKEIKITGGECDNPPKSFKTWKEAGKHIRAHIAPQNQPSGGYVKTDFIIIFDNEEEYAGRLDVMHPQASTGKNDHDLAAHVYDFQRFHTGEAKPDHLTDEQYNHYMKVLGPEAQDQAREFLANYDIPKNDLVMAESDLTYCEKCGELFAPAEAEKLCGEHEAERIKILNRWQMPEGDRRSIYTKETAVIIRERLKAEFKGVKFFVRIDSYSMGSSIDIDWQDGPTAKEVSAITGDYRSDYRMPYGGGSVYITHWLLSDLSTMIAYDGGGYDQEPSGNPRPDDTAELVSFSGSIGASRQLSPDFLRKVVKTAEAKLILTAPDIVESTWTLRGSKVERPLAYFDHNLGNEPMDLFNRMARDTSDYHKPEAKPEAKPTEANGNSEAVTVAGFTLTVDRDWTWLETENDLTCETLGKLSANGFKWSRKRKAWYARQIISVDQLHAALS